MSTIPDFDPSKAGTAQVSGPYANVRVTRDKDGYRSESKDRRKITRSVNENCNRVPHSPTT